jgi:thioester reductase-like protein
MCLPVGGFLGVFLLREILKQTEMNVYCLIREHTVESAWEKLCKSCEKYQVEVPSCDRVTVIVGDLSKENFGISTEQFFDLAEKIDTIYHNGITIKNSRQFSRCCCK